MREHRNFEQLEKQLRKYRSMTFSFAHFNSQLALTATHTNTRTITVLYREIQWAQVIHFSDKELREKITIHQ